MTSPTVRRRRLGAELRALREAAGLTHQQVAEHLECSQGKISHIESGRVPVRTVDLRMLIDQYRAPTEQADALFALAKEARDKGWWQAYRTTLAPGLSTFIGLEAAARSVRTTQGMLVPTLLRTDAYELAVLRGGLTEISNEERADRMKVHDTRKARLTGGGTPLEYWAIIDEDALDRPIGGVKAMREQLAHILELGALHNVTVQVVPRSMGVHPLMGERVTILEFPDPADPQVAYLESMFHSVYLQKREDLRELRQRLDFLVATALSPSESVKAIRQLSAELSDRATDADRSGGYATGAGSAEPGHGPGDR